VSSSVSPSPVFHPWPHLWPAQVQLYTTLLTLPAVVLSDFFNLWIYFTPDNEESAAVAKSVPVSTNFVSLPRSFQLKNIAEGFSSNSPAGNLLLCGINVLVRCS
jgi:hypothetical protein